MRPEDFNVIDNLPEVQSLQESQSILTQDNFKTLLSRLDSIDKKLSIIQECLSEDDTIADMDGLSDSDDTLDSFPIPWSEKKGSKEGEWRKKSNFGGKF